MIGTKALAVLLLSLTTFVCSMPPQQTPTAKQPQAKDNYPPVIEASPARAQAAEDTWNQFLSEYKLTFAAPDLDATHDDVELNLLESLVGRRTPWIRMSDQQGRY